MTRYRFTTRPTFLLWVLFAVAIRIPNASAPLAMVFLGHGATGTYASGGAIAAAFVIGEVAGSALLGWIGRDDRVRRDVTIGLIVGGIGFAVLASSSLVGYPALIIGAVLAGAGPAQSGGALRAALGRIVAEVDLPRAYSIDSVLTELVWLIAPALVAFAAVAVSPYAVLILNASLLGVAAVLALSRGGRLLAADDSATSTQATSPRTALLSAWPVYLTSAAALSLLAVAELVLPSLLVERGYNAGWSGALLAVFAGASALASLIYGARRWPGTVRTQSFTLLIGTAAALAAMAFAPTVVLIGVALVLAGVFQAVVMITRNLTLRAELPTEQHTAGFTIMYSVQGAGYAASAILASAVLDRSGAPAAIGAGIAVMAALTAVSIIGEAVRPVRRRSAAAAGGAQ
ncbi:MFS transporter [Curtobacterium sp. MCBD17_040]|uniref:MFS transporter n=1 Tax=Curtobacterium sp. MCBD17_040 TaxID=2175674 RepID=UPI000DA8F746|nr:MFS transporter [Curtobacterium sp. MCBD17_040]WIB65844.1 hypothetical protein DEI94_17165 [Curtobacterium sp. MCBD17_040]